MYPPPLYICFVQAGPRIGYRWQDWEDYNSSSEHYQFSACEVNWLDPEPEKESSDYGKYINELQEINSQVIVYKGFNHVPPSEDEYRGLVTPLVRRDARYYYEEYDSDIEEWLLRRQMM